VKSINTIIVKDAQNLAEDVLRNAVNRLSHNEALYPHDQDFCNKQSAIKTILKLKEAAGGSLQFVRFCTQVSKLKT